MTRLPPKNKQRPIVQRDGSLHGALHGHKQQRILIYTTRLGCFMCFAPPLTPRPLPAEQRGAYQARGSSLPRGRERRPQVPARRGRSHRPPSTSACLLPPMARRVAAFSPWPRAAAPFSPQPRPAGPARSPHGCRDRALRAPSQWTPRASLRATEATTGRGRRWPRGSSCHSCVRSHGRFVRPR